MLSSRSRTASRVMVNGAVLLPEPRGYSRQRRRPARISRRGSDASALPDMLDTRGLHAYYGSSHILHGVDFSVAKGEVVALMGRNGMGKTTLIRSMLGLVTPRSGSVHMEGTPITGWPPFRIARLGVAYIPEGRGIFPNLWVARTSSWSARASGRAKLDTSSRPPGVPATGGASRTSGHSSPEASNRCLP